jgi:outer membrane protein assembly factor BamD (BamD/ComL family)
MYFLKSRKDSNFWRFGWHFLFAFLILVSVILGGIGWCVRQSSESAGTTLLTVGICLGILSIVYAVFSGLLLALEIVRSLKTNGEKLDNSAEMLARQNTLLAQISQGVRLSDTAKEIVFRDAEQMELGEAALNKLHQHDFEDAEAMVAAMAEQPKYRELSLRLKRMADKYRSATEEGRINQVVAHIEELFEQNLWAQATVQIENFIKTFPHSDKAKSMPARLRERKDQHKRELLADWDQAIRNKDTDHGLEVLKELDLYLTPAEALALQESAATVFRTKLHNLGVDFSVAVTEKNWRKAFELGKDIVLNFPNSRMAAEIRSKMDILQERANATVKEHAGV